MAADEANMLSGDFMTNREKINSQCSGFMVRILVLFFVSLFLFPFWGWMNMHPDFTMATMIIGVIVYGGIFLHGMATIRCPKCHARLFSSIFVQSAFSPVVKVPEKMKHCPFCGVEFDQPTPDQ